MGEALIVPILELKDWWWRVRELILSAERTFKGESEEQIVASLLQDQYKLAVVCEDGVPVVAATFEVLTIPEGKVAVVRQLGGNFPAAWENREYFLSWLRVLGAEKLMLSGRRGWAKRLRPLGFKERFVTMEVDLGRWR